MKTHASLLLVALSALGATQDRPPIKYDAGAIQALADRMNKLTSTNWQDGFAFGQELAELPSPLGYQILRDNWTKGASIEARKQMFKGFVFENHPDSLLVLNLGMNDPHLSMQAWSMSYLRSLFLVDFSTDFSKYAPWFDKMRALPLKQVRQKSIEAGLDAVLATPDERLDKAAQSMAQSLNGNPVKGYPKMAPLIDRLIDAPSSGVGGVTLAAQLLASDALPREATEKDALRLLDRKEMVQSGEALKSLIKLQIPALMDRLFPFVKTVAPGETGNVYVLADALLASEDPRTIPFLIDLMPNLKTEMAQMVHSALINNLGVQAGNQVDPAWWRDWLQNNQSRLHARFDESKLPSFKVDAVPTAQYIPDADDVKAIPSASFLVGEDPKKRYFVSGKIEPGKTKNVLVVMPGGDGSPEFHPFIKRIQMNVLDENWIVVQPIAPRWDNNGDRVVWPSEGVPYAAAKFPMETFLDGMFDELRTRHKLNVGKTYMLGWSSSGPAIYSYAAHGKHTIDGAFVAMAVFNPGFFGDAKTLNVKRFYLLHSPQDFIKMSHPEAAKAKLEAMKIPVTLTTYEGGHGWHGPVFDMIARGMDFLKG